MRRVNRVRAGAQAARGWRRWLRARALARLIRPSPQVLIAPVEPAPAANAGAEDERYARFHVIPPESRRARLRARVDHEIVGVAVGHISAYVWRAKLPLKLR